MPIPNWLPGKFVWFELASSNPKVVKPFYAEVFGWRTVAFPMSDDVVCDMIYAGDTMIGSYAPVTSARTDVRPSHWLSFVSVDDVDACVKIATYKGGSVTEAPRDIPNVGRVAKIVDPQGAPIALLKKFTDDPVDNEQTPHGQWLWGELHTPDTAAALAFYESMVGYTHRSMDMGPGGTYHILRHGETERAGVTSHLPPGAPAHWLPYVAVDDVDQTLDRARRLGARIPMSPEDIAGVGRFGIVADPTGAMVAMLKPLPRQK